MPGVAIAPRIEGGTGIDITPEGRISSTGGPPGGAAGGDLGGFYPNPLVVGFQGRPMSALAPAPGDLITWNGVSWVPMAGGGGPPGGPAGGDLSGLYPNPVVAQFQTRPFSAAAPALNDVIAWTGATWAPTPLPASFPPSGPAGGDLSGAYPNPVVAQLQTRPMSAAAPAIGDVIKWSGAAWAPAPDVSAPTGPAGGDLAGVYPNPTVAQFQTRPMSAAAPAVNDVILWNGATWMPSPAPGGSPTGAAGGDLAGTYPNPTVLGLTNVGTNLVFNQAAQANINPAAGQTLALATNTVRITTAGLVGIATVPVAERLEVGGNALATEFRGPAGAPLILRSNAVAQPIRMALGATVLGDWTNGGAGAEATFTTDVASGVVNTRFIANGGTAIWQAGQTVQLQSGTGQVLFRTTTPTTWGRWSTNGGLSIIDFDPEGIGFGALMVMPTGAEIRVTGTGVLTWNVGARVDTMTTTGPATFVYAAGTDSVTESFNAKNVDEAAGYFNRTAQAPLNGATGSNQNSGGFSNTVLAPITTNKFGVFRERWNSASSDISSRQLTFDRASFNTGVAQQLVRGQFTLPDNCAATVRMAVSVQDTAGGGVRTIVKYFICSRFGGGAVIDGVATGAVVIDDGDALAGAVLANVVATGNDIVIEVQTVVAFAARVQGWMEIWINAA